MEVVMYAFHVAVLLNRVDIVDKLFLQKWPDLDVNAKSLKRESALHVAAHEGWELMLRYLLMKEKLNINVCPRVATKSRGPDVPHKTALHITCEHGYANLVDLLYLDEKNKEVIRCYEEDADNMTALDIVCEKLKTEVWEECCLQHKEPECATCHTSYEDIEKTLLRMKAVEKGVERLYRNRQELVDAANAILVGAALIASVTFAGWLQPPLGYAQYYEYPIPDPAPPGTYGSYLGDHVGIQIFATATVIVGADAAFPIDRCTKIHVHTGHVVKAMKFLLRRAIKFLMASVVCVLGAFGSAAVVMLPPHVYFRRHLVATIFTGGGLSGVMLWQLFTRHSATVRQLNAWIRSVIYEYTNLFSLPPFLVRFMKEDEND